MLRVKIEWYYECITVAVMAILLLAGTASAAPIPADVAISCTVSYDTAFSYSDPGTSHTGSLRIVAGGSPSTCTFADGAITSGSHPLSTALTDTGDAIDIYDVTTVASNDAGTSVGVDAVITLTNTSSTVTYVTALDISFTNTANSTGANAFVHSECTIDKVLNEVFFTDIESDLDYGNKENGIQQGGFGGSVADARTDHLTIILGPGTGVVFKVGLTAKVKPSILSVAESTFDMRIAVRSVASSDSDSDSDGASDIEEAIAGTDVNDPADFFMISDTTIQGTNVVTTWPSRSGRVYTLYSSSALTGGTPVIEAANITTTSPEHSYTSSPSASESVLFYFLKVQDTNP